MKRLFAMVVLGADMDSSGVYGGSWEWKALFWPLARLVNGDYKSPILCLSS